MFEDTYGWDPDHLAFCEDELTRHLAARRETRRRMLTTIGPEPKKPPARAGADERAAWADAHARWLDRKHSIERTPREHAEVTWTSEYWGSVDDLENDIRWRWGRPQVDHDTGLERGDLHGDAVTRAQSEWWALDFAREFYPGNPSGLPWEDYLELFREIEGITASPPPMPLEEQLDLVRARRGLGPVYGHEFTDEQLRRMPRGGETT